MKIFKRIIYLLLFLLLVFFVVSSFFEKANLKPVKAQLDDLDLEGVNKLMIIAHPEDETVWGGSHLLEDNYLVVCLSCGFDGDKDQKLKKVLNITDDKLVMMGFSDKYLIKHNYKKVSKNLKKILKYKNWELVVTHNPEGEYGNLEHKQINQIVSDLDIDNLYYFGKYYSKKELNKMDKVTTIKSSIIKDKTDKLIEVYNDKNINRYKHMFPFEDWISREEFKM